MGKKKARTLLDEIKGVNAAIGTALRQRGSRYQAGFADDPERPLGPIHDLMDGER